MTILKRSRELDISSIFSLKSVFRFKNITPRKLSVMAGLVISGTMFLAISILGFWFRNGISWYYGIIGLLVLFAVSYFTILYFVQRFIFRKIKLIYKSIRSSRRDSSHKLKTSTEVDLDENIFEEVEREVVDWSNTQQHEINQLRHLEQYRKDYVGNVAHELRTPIFNIQGYLHTLLDGAIEDPEINMRYLEKASENLDRLNVIVEGLDAINKLESGKMILDIQKINIKALVSDVFGELELKAKEKNISLLFKDGASTPFYVMADPEAIRQVLVNLIMNSIKYGREGGRTMVSFYDMDKYILVEISDTGIGVHQKHLRHLFDRFYRVDKSRSRKEGGSGLGLSIVKHIIEAHNETITVRSKPDVGTTFGFTLRRSKDS